ncbi:response regulator [Egbenema bharatensis]|uniref:response regulator n=1 Tax=Egbenema bharatensis TaxID=3463334 RepID=UPI003A869B58
MQNAFSHSQPSTPPGSGNELSNLRILLAEDNVLNQKLTVRQLSGLGFWAEVVANGQAAVDAVTHATSDFTYDLVLMDCQMPELDGFAATQAIRDWERSRGLQSHPIVIVAMTASDLRQDQQRAIEVGMDDYLVKPIRQEGLRRLLERWGHVALHRTAIRSSALSSVSSSPASRQSSPSLSSPSPNLPASTHSTIQNGSIALDETRFRHLSSHLHHLHRLADGSPEFAAELLQLFISDSYQHLHQLQLAIISQDFLQIEQIAHHLKGASANLGADAIQRIAEEVEQRSRQQQGEGLGNLAIRLEASLRQLEMLV